MVFVLISMLALLVLWADRGDTCNAWTTRQFLIDCRCRWPEERLPNINFMIRFVFLLLSARVSLSLSRSFFNLLLFVVIAVVLLCRCCCWARCRCGLLYAPLLSAAVKTIYFFFGFVLFEYLQSVLFHFGFSISIRLFLLLDGHVWPQQSQTLTQTHSHTHTLRSSAAELTL